MMILRVQSPGGTKRIECENDTTTAKLFEKIQDAFGLPSVFSFKIFSTRCKSKMILNQERKDVSDYQLKHGDMLYLEYSDVPMDDANPVGDSTVSGAGKTTAQLTDSSKLSKLTTGGASVNPESLEEDEVDRILRKIDGHIQRGRDEKLCRHKNDNSRCVHCAPLEPWDEGYMKEHNVKHLSFHAHIRKITAGQSGKFANLENISCRVKPGCTAHAPWPKGICSKCQPSAITLNQQTYRHVDSIMFENASIVDRFLNYWRVTVHQRVGYLYGRYEPHTTTEIPLGIRATVAAIYEPPQESTKDKIRLLPDVNAAIVDEVAKGLGLQRVGWVFTDLVPDDLQKGTVKHLRNIDTSFLLSAQECITAGHFQNEHPNICRWSPDGYFGSKFVTVCITGDKSNRVQMEGYQVSNQCMALVRDKCLVPTIDAPELAYVKESSSEQYVPDVFYKTKDSYGNQVAQLARPLPVEYLLIDVPASTPVEPQYTFPVCPKPFPVENRLIEGHLQDIHAMCEYLQPFVAERNILAAVSDFHVLTYLACLELVPFRPVIGSLLKAVREKDAEAANQWAANTEAWQTFEQIMQSAPAPSHASGSAGSGGSGTRVWTCNHCTFSNATGLNTCEMCGLPQQ